MAEQELEFQRGQADSWFERNSGVGSHILKMADNDHIVISCLKKLKYRSEERIQFLDLGGSTGYIAAKLADMNKEWQANVLELSSLAITKGRELFPNVKYINGSVCQDEGFGKSQYDLILILGVFCWIDRGLLTQAIRNIDMALREGGSLVIGEFDCPYPKKNSYNGSRELFTFKQKYYSIFESIGTYNLLHKETTRVGSVFDKNDYFDNMWSVTILEKSSKKFYIS